MKIKPSFTPILLLALSLAAASMTVMAQEEDLPQASDLDWTSWEDLPEEERLPASELCCGRYLAPAIPVPDAEPGAISLRAASQYSDDNVLFTLEGDVEILRDGAQLQADEAIYDRASGMAELRGNIRIRQPGALLVGAEAELDENSASGLLRDASYVLHDEAARGTAEIIVYTSADGLITIDNGRYTRCEPGNNAWTLAGGSMVLDRQRGRGVARNVTLRAGKVPLLYLPAISFPINDERATGFLAPSIGSARHGGIDFAAPYYLNLAPHYDATLTPRLLTERGAMLELEGRHQGRRSLNVLTANLLPDDNLYNEARSHLPDGDSPPVPDRWLLSYDHSSRLGANWAAFIDYSTVSDQDYFQDLGNTGLYTTTQSHLQRSGQLLYQTANWSLRTAAQDFQVIDPAVGEGQQPYRSLPRIQLDAYFHSDFGLEYGLDSEYVRFARDLNARALSQAQIAHGALVVGQRLSLEPVLRLPWASPGAFITPTLKYKYAAYQLEDPGGAYGGNPSRGIFMGSLDGGLIFERELRLKNATLTQTLEPRLFYLYSGYENQDDIPLFDSSQLTFGFSQLFREDRFSGGDRVGDANQLTLALSTRFLDQRGREKASASIGQIRYFADRRVALSGLPGAAQRTGSSALAADFSYQLHDNWRINSYLEWDTRENTLSVGGFQFRYQSAINRILNFSHRYREVPNPIGPGGLDRRIRQTDLSAAWPLGGNWGLVGRWNYDHANDRNLETLAGLEYRNCCYTARIIAREWIDNDALFFGDMDHNRGVFLQLELRGFGSILGGNVRGILESGVSGYREGRQPASIE